jgi:hypothetical protein
MRIPANLRWELRNDFVETWGKMVLLFGMLGGCSIPGAIAPSNLPITDDYVEVGPLEEKTSCGHAFLMIPFGNPEPVSDIIESMIQARGGDALVNISSESSSSFYLLGSSNCVTIRGTVVRFQ